VLGLARAAALWWTYAYIPMLLGIVTLAAGLKRVIGQAGVTQPYPACLALGAGVALYLAGDAAFRRVLGIGRQLTRVSTAAPALAASAVGVTLSVTAEIALLAAIVVVALACDREPGGPDAVEQP
jgi:low temperature requirement protein LtrA